MKWLLKQYMMGGVIVLGLVLTTPVSAAQALSLPSMGTFADVTTCALPDGSVGVVQPDQKTCCPNGTTVGNSCLFAKYINPLINLLAAAAGVAAVIAIIVGGIEYSASAGDPQQAARGRQHITNALIGLLAFFLLYGFLQFILPGGLLSEGLLNG